MHSLPQHRLVIIINNKLYFKKQKIYIHVNALTIPAIFSCQFSTLRRPTCNVHELLLLFQRLNVLPTNSIYCLSLV